LKKDIKNISQIGIYFDDKCFEFLSLLISKIFQTTFIISVFFVWNEQGNLTQQVLDSTILASLNFTKQNIAIFFQPGHFSTIKIDLPIKRKLEITPTEIKTPKKVKI